MFSPLTIPTSTSRHPTNLMSSPLLDRQHYFSSPISPGFKLESIYEHSELPQGCQDVYRESLPSLTTQLSNYSLSTSTSNPSSTIRPSIFQNLSQAVSSSQAPSVVLPVKKRKFIVKIPTVFFCEKEERESGEDVTLPQYSRYDSKDTIESVSIYPQGRATFELEIEVAENVSITIQEYEIKLQSLPPTIDIYLPGQNAWKDLRAVHSKDLLDKIERQQTFRTEQNQFRTSSISSTSSIATSNPIQPTEIAYLQKSSNIDQKSTLESPNSSPSRSSSILDEFKLGGILARRLSLAAISELQNTIPSSFKIRSLSLPNRRFDSSSQPSYAHQDLTTATSTDSAIHDRTLTSEYDQFSDQLDSTSSLSSIKLYPNFSPYTPKHTESTSYSELKHLKSDSIKLDPTSPCFQFVQSSQKFSVQSYRPTILDIDPLESIKSALTRSIIVSKRNIPEVSVSRRTSIGISSSTTYTPPVMEDLSDLAVSDSQSSASTEYRGELNSSAPITNEYENFPPIHVHSQWIVESILERLEPLIDRLHLKLSLEDKLRRIEDKLDSVFSTSSAVVHDRLELSTSFTSILSRVQNLESGSVYSSQKSRSEQLHSSSDSSLRATTLESKVTTLEKELFESRLQNQKLLERLDL